MCMCIIRTHNMIRNENKDVGADLIKNPNIRNLILWVIVHMAMKTIRISVRMDKSIQSNLDYPHSSGPW